MDEKFRVYRDGAIDFWRAWLRSDGQVDMLGDVFRGGRRETQSRRYASLDEYRAARERMGRTVTV